MEKLEAPWTFSPSEVIKDDPHPVEDDPMDYYDDPPMNDDDYYENDTKNELITPAPMSALALPKPVPALPKPVPSTLQPSKSLNPIAFSKLDKLNPTCFENVGNAPKEESFKRSPNHEIPGLDEPTRSPTPPGKKLGFFFSITNNFLNIDIVSI